MKICFQADADLDKTIIIALLRIEPAIDFQTAHDANLEGISDPEVLEKTASEGRLLVSHDQRTMPHYFAEFIQTQTSAGIFIIPQHTPLTPAVEDLLLIWWEHEPEDWINRISYYPL
jgi:hypothetical protein